ncbi:MAG: hypothetical protein RLZZ161_227 [Bacteroidota bacterium]
MFLFFSLYSLFNKQGNLLLNRLFGLALFSRFCQIFTYYLTLRGGYATLYGVYPLNNVMQVVSPVLFFLYMQSFIHDRSALKPVQYLHFIPAALLVLDVVTWFTAPINETSNILNGFIQQKKFFLTQPNSIIPEVWQHPLRRGLTALYLIGAWWIVLKHTHNQTWSLQKRWVYFLITAPSPSTAYQRKNTMSVCRRRQG